MVWYLFSTAATFTNKILIKEHHVSAEMLTLCHLFISVLCDCTSFPNSPHGHPKPALTMRVTPWQSWC